MALRKEIAQLRLTREEQTVVERALDVVDSGSSGSSATECAAVERLVHAADVAMRSPGTRRRAILEWKTLVTLASTYAWAAPLLDPYVTSLTGYSLPGAGWVNATAARTGINAATINLGRQHLRNVCRVLTARTMASVKTLAIKLLENGGLRKRVLRR
jgi:hypothetical protein